MDLFKTLLEEKLEDKGFSKKQIDDIKDVLDDVCLHCLDGDKS